MISISQSIKKIKSIASLGKRLISGYPTEYDKKGAISAPKVKDHIIWLNIVNTVGSFERVAAFEGQSLLDVLFQYKVDGVPGTCHGGEDINTVREKPVDPVAYGPFCANCHVVISDPWVHQIDPPHQLEQTTLEKRPGPITPNSRLACCIVLDKTMNEMIITIGQNEPVLDEID